MLLQAVFLVYLTSFAVATHPGGGLQHQNDLLAEILGLLQPPTRPPPPRTTTTTTRAPVVILQSPVIVQTNKTWPTPLTFNQVPAGNYSFPTRPIFQAVTPNQVTEIVNVHNSLRNQLAGGQISGYPPASNMLQLVYDSDLARLAQDHSSACVFAHGCNNCGQVPQNFGQNLFWGTGLTFTSAINGWFNEYRTGPTNIATYSFSEANGHFTQIAWATTASVGCGLTNCGGSNYIVCNYRPAGNLIGSSIYRSGTPCSACPSGYSCSAGETLAASGLPLQPTGTVLTAPGLPVQPTWTVNTAPGTAPVLTPAVPASIPSTFTNFQNLCRTP